MSGSWAGVQASEAAIKNNVFSTTSMPIVQAKPFTGNNPV
jgi:hypothetical protein